MKTVYIDFEYRCHITNPEGIFQEVETDFFDNKCITFIEGYRYIPSGESWTRSDGIIFHGEMISPWKPYDELDQAQRNYEKQKLNNCLEALQELGVET